MTNCCPKCGFNLGPQAKLVRNIDLTCCKCNPADWPDEDIHQAICASYNEDPHEGFCHDCGHEQACHLETP